MLFFTTKEYLESNDNGISRLSILHGNTKRVQCNGPAEVRLSMQHDMIEDNNWLLSSEKNGEHDNVNGLLIQHNSLAAQDLLIHFVPEVRKKRDRAGDLSSGLEQQGTRNQLPQSVSSKRRRTSSLKETVTFLRKYKLFKLGSEVVLRTSTYPNKRNVAYATIKCTDPTTKDCGIELGAEFTRVA